jgi:hypothetical protein
MLSDDLRHRPRPAAPSAPQLQHKTADRRVRITIDGSQIEAAARPATRAVDFDPWKADDDGGADRRRSHNGLLAVS